MDTPIIVPPVIVRAPNRHSIHQNFSTIENRNGHETLQPNSFSKGALSSSDTLVALQQAIPGLGNLSTLPSIGLLRQGLQGLGDLPTISPLPPSQDFHETVDKINQSISNLPTCPDISSVLALGTEPIPNLPDTTPLPISIDKPDLQSKLETKNINLSEANKPTGNFQITQIANVQSAMVDLIAEGKWQDAKALALQSGGKSPEPGITDASLDKNGNNDKKSKLMPIWDITNSSNPVGSTVSTRSSLKFLSMMTNNTLAGSVIDNVNSIYMLAHGNSNERYQSAESLGKEITIGVGLGAVGGIVAEGFLPAFSRLGSWGIGGVEGGSFESTSLRQARMLEKNTGYNIAPENWFNDFNTLGREGTFITDYRAIGDVLGPIRADTKFNTGFFTRGNTISFFKAGKLERALGLQPGSLSKEGFRFSRISKIDQLHPRSPLEGNAFFTKPGQGLPGGGPELVIDSLPTNPWPRRVRNDN